MSVTKSSCFVRAICAPRVVRAVVVDPVLAAHCGPIVPLHPWRRSLSQQLHEGLLVSTNSRPGERMQNVVPPEFDMKACNRTCMTCDSHIPFELLRTTYDFLFNDLYFTVCFMWRGQHFDVIRIMCTGPSPCVFSCCSFGSVEILVENRCRRVVASGYYRWHVTTVSCRDSFSVGSRTPPSNRWYISGSSPA